MCFHVQLQRAENNQKQISQFKLNPYYIIFILSFDGNNINDSDIKNI